MKNYEINEDTYVVIGENFGRTKVIEKDNSYEINEEAYKIMDDNCKYYGSSYYGRVEASKAILNCSYKLPVIVEESSSMIFFPIKSTLLDDCTWINLNSIKCVEKLGSKTKITFINDKEMIFDISKLSLENQIYKSSKLETTIIKRINAFKRGE